jgi:hypothetical protein
LWNRNAFGAEKGHRRGLTRHDQSNRLNHWIWDASYKLEAITEVDNEGTISGSLAYFVDGKDVFKAPIDQAPQQSRS